MGVMGIWEGWAVEYSVEFTANNISTLHHWLLNHASCV